MATSKISSNRIPTVVNTKVNYTFTAANTWEYTGLSVTIPAKSEAVFMFQNEYQSANPTGIAVTHDNTTPPSSASTSSWRNWAYSETSNTVYVCGYFINETTLYVWAKASSTNRNGIYTTGTIRIYNA